jgi:hypothetical protein
MVKERSVFDKNQIEGSIKFVPPVSFLVIKFLRSSENNRPERKLAAAG